MTTAAAVRFPGDMPREPADTIQISVRVPMKWLDELDELAKDMSRPGIELGRADALRASIARGMQDLRAEIVAAAKPPPRKR